MRLPPFSNFRRTLAGSLRVVDPRKPIGPDDLFPDDRAPTAPRIARFLGADGAPRIGIVLESSEGVPRRILDLTTDYGVGPGLMDFVTAGGFELVEKVLEDFETGDLDETSVVTIAAQDLSERLLSPVDISKKELRAGKRVIIGFGLTYRPHQQETGRLRPIVFPKPAVPTGAYAPVVAGREFETQEPVRLLDYELELGCVALRDIDLDQLDRIDPAKDFAYLITNDVSARAPILRNRRSGYAEAKGRPTFLPTGPWIVPGDHFTRDDPSLRRMVLFVEEANENPGNPDAAPRRRTIRQNARLEELTLGLRELLELVSRRRTLTMRGHDGRRWHVCVVREGRSIVPAGSLLLTGTPGGTAIRAPDLADRIKLVLRSGRYMRWPSESYRQHLERHAKAFGFLAPGDRVSGWITGLGRQHWEVVQ